jgi:FixJ family two-component response regulator
MSIEPTDRSRRPCNNIETATVYILDDDTSTRGALESLVARAGWRTMPATSAEAFMALPRTFGPSCLLMELNLPDLSGLELQELILDRSELQVIFMSCHVNIRATVRAMKSGAFEFLTKPFPDEVLLNSVELAMNQSRIEVSRLQRTRALEQRYQTLSVREREVMELVVAGRLNKQVGAALGISEITVKAHRGRAMRKMQARSLAELVNMATVLGLRDPGDFSEPKAPKRISVPDRVSPFVPRLAPAIWQRDAVSA